jgi:predicted alpha/beta superfamily hydrolase
MLEEFRIHITPLQRDRMLRVYLPDSYHRTDKAYPVLYMHDGQNLFRDADASFGTCWGLQEFLDQSGLEVIVVGIDCNPDGFGRFNEYAPWPNPTIRQTLFGTPGVLGGEGKAYVDYIVKELKPFIDRRYRTLVDDTAMAGSSMGGHISTYAACVYPHVFRRIASVSSAYWFNQAEIEDLIRQSDLTSIRAFYMDVGTREETATIDSRMYIESSVSVYEVLREKIGNLRFEIIEGAVHHERDWRKRVPDIFAFLYRD